MTVYKHPILPAIKIDVMEGSMFVIIDGDVVGTFDNDDFDRLWALNDLSETATPKADLAEFFESVLDRCTARQAELVAELFYSCIDEINHVIQGGVS